MSSGSSRTPAVRRAARELARSPRRRYRSAIRQTFAIASACCLRDRVKIGRRTLGHLEDQTYAGQSMIGVCTSRRVEPSRLPFEPFRPPIRQSSPATRLPRNPSDIRATVHPLRHTGMVVSLSGKPAARPGHHISTEHMIGFRVCRQTSVSPPPLRS
jgi:hypothetical protein